jgi:TetR/AcrR family transcriptional regulator, regulator of cefoperazone and chloramphenicol sensitivity
MRYRPSAARAGTAPARTREQLLAAAREVFSEAGFHHATIREISRRAGANIAAVNYHFRDKAGLYAAVVLETARVARGKYPEQFGLPPRPTPEQRLHAFVRSLLLRTLSSGPHAQHGKLLTRELIEPSPALDGIVRDDLQPMASSLLSIVRDLLGRKASPDLVQNCGLSVAGQIFFLFHCRPVLNRLFPDMTYAEADIERLASHITRFSLAAIKKLARAGRAPR